MASKGCRRKSTAPAFMVATASGTSASAENSTTGLSMPWRAICCNNSSPSMSGNKMLATMQPPREV